MYFSIAFILFALLLSVVLCTAKKRSAVRKVCSLNSAEKCELLNELAEPLGYCYYASQDIITSHPQAWQREFGYTALFDYAAPHFNMVFDFLPVYFDYQEKTWLIEFWKGQYGINTGAEIGVYYADRLLSEEEYGTAHFTAVSDEDMLQMSLCLNKDGCPLAALSEKTWWLTAFSMARFSRPGDLYVNLSVIFPNFEMLHAFLYALSKTSIPRHCIQVRNMQVHIQFGGYVEISCSFLNRLTRRWSQFTNRIYCRLFLLLTHCFFLTADRLLYLYFLLPFCFYHTLRLRRWKGHKSPC